MINSSRRAVSWAVDMGCFSPHQEKGSSEPTPLTRCHERDKPFVYIRLTD